MLAVRIIPTLLHRGTTLVKGRQFNSWRSVGHVQQAARIYAARGVDELCILDIGATPEGRGPDLALVEQLTAGNFTPIAIGGGVTSLETVQALLRAGADKVVIGRGGHGTGLIPAIAETIGRQAIIAALDYTDTGLVRVLIQKTRKCYDVAMSPVSFACALEASGAGEILLTCINREGTMEGYDLPLIKAVASAVDIPVIAHGGAGTYQHMYEAIQAGASAVAAGAMFQFTDQTPREAAEYLAGKGVTVRL